MKHIEKRPPPVEYREWCAPTNDWNPSWGALDDDRAMRRTLVAALLVEQKYLCAYCNVRIATEPGRHHVEHLLPRRLIEPNRALEPEAAADIERCGIPRDRLDIDYRNLLACCPNKEGKAGTSSCGDHKAGELLPLTPLDPGCETAFQYLLSGEVKSELDAGTRAIRVLGLKRPNLVQARRRALEGWLQVLEEVEALVPEDRRSEYLARLLEADDDGKLPEFVVAAAQLLHAGAP